MSDGTNARVKSVALVFFWQAPRMLSFSLDETGMGQHP